MDKNIDQINGQPMIDIIKKITLFKDEYADFKNPDKNKGYNIVIIDGFPEENDQTIDGKMKNALSRGLTSPRMDAGTVANYTRVPWDDEIFTKEFKSSNAFKDAIAQKRGIVFVFLPKGIIPNSSEWANNLNDVQTGANLRGGIMTLAHEIIAHAINRALEGNDFSEYKEHVDFHKSKGAMQQWDNTKGTSPDLEFTKKYLPNSKAAKVLNEIDTQIELLKTKKNKSK